MKTILTLLCIWSAATVGFAQSSEPVKPTQEIGFNTNFILYGLLHSEGSPFRSDVQEAAI